jgi:endonuclease/exonuclease/phosphatase family metal-dependent hydrolase
MTWNLWWHFGDWEARQGAIEAVVRATDPDVLFLQEVWSDETSDQAADLAGKLGLHMVRTDPVLWNGQSFGNAILSRWPLERIADEALPNADGEPSHRRVVAARLDTPYGHWPVASTHLEHRADQSATRQKQCVRLLELASEWRGEPTTDLPLVVGADLNAVPDADEVRMMTGRSPGIEGLVFSDAWEQAGEGRGDTWRGDNPYCADTAWPNRRLDYLLVSWPRPRPTGNPRRCWVVGDGPVEVSGSEPVWASDHVAVVAELETP